MKRVFCLLLALILALPMSACGFDSSTPAISAEPTEPTVNYDEILQKAESAMDAGYYAAAFSYLEEAGDAGKATKEKVQEAFKQELFLRFGDYNLENAIDLASKCVPQYVSEDLYHSWVLEYAQQTEDAVSAFLQTPGDETDQDGYDLLYKLRDINKLIEAVNLTAGPENVAFFDQHYLNAGLLEFYLSGSMYDESGYTTGYNYLQNCSEGSDGQIVIEALAQLRQYQYSDGIAVLEQYLPNKEALSGVLTYFRAEDIHGDDCNQLLDYYSTLNRTSTKEESYGNLTDYINANPNELSYGIDRESGSISLEGNCRDQLKELCGTAPDGKILILHRRKIYGSKSTELDMCNNIMQNLPEEYYPHSLEEVEFIILMNTTYAKKGKFQNGTVRILETTKLTLYNAATGKKMVTASKKGQLANTMYYFGTAPKYFSCGSPEMRDPLLKAMNAISEAMNQ